MLANFKHFTGSPALEIRQYRIVWWSTNSWLLLSKGIQVEWTLVISHAMHDI